MKGLHVKLFISMAVLIFAVKTASQETEEAQHFCGRKLAETLAVLCEDSYENSEKRSRSYNSVYDDDFPRYHGWPWVTRHHARAFEVPARGKRYIVDECCKKACTLKELMDYC